VEKYKSFPQNLTTILIIRKTLSIFIQLLQLNIHLKGNKNLHVIIQLYFNFYI
jgi:hypothetical protein